jgi:hypothetical protein
MAGRWAGALPDGRSDCCNPAPAHGRLTGAHGRAAERFETGVSSSDSSGRECPDQQIVIILSETRAAWEVQSEVKER